jgi:hypothetical protein
VALPLLGVAFLLFVVAVLRDRDTLFVVAFLLVGVAVLLFVVAVLRDGNTLVGVAGLLLGVAFLLAGVAALSRSHARDAGVDRRPARPTWLTADRSQPKSAVEPSTAQPGVSQAGSSLPADDDGPSQNPSPDTPV